MTVRILLVLALVGAFAMRPLLQAAGRYLGPQDPLLPAEAIIVISGNNPERVATGARLLLDEYGRWLILSGGPRPVAEMRALALRRGASDAQILTDMNAQSTLENAYGTAGVMRAHGLHTAILVTSPYHMRRAIILFRGVFGREGLIVRAYPAQPSIFRVDRWWQRRQDRQFVLREYAKLLAVLIGIR